MQADCSALRQCHQLSSMVICKNAMDENDLAEILNHCPGELTDITFQSQWVVEPALTALEGLFDRIRILDLSVSVHGYESWWNQKILCSCPNLVEFYCREFRTEDCLVPFGSSYRGLNNDYVDNDHDMNYDKGGATETTTNNSTVQTIRSGTRGHHRWICAPTLQALEIRRLIWSVDDNRKNEQMMEQLKELRQMQSLQIGVIGKLSVLDESPLEPVQGVMHPKLWKMGAFLPGKQEEHSWMQWTCSIWPDLEVFWYYGWFNA